MKAFGRYWALEEHGEVIRIIFLDFRKVFVLIENNILLENCEKIGFAQPLFPGLDRTSGIEPKWLTKFGKEYSQEVQEKGGVPQGSKIGLILFVIHINDFILAISQGNSQEEDITLFMDDSTISEVFDMSQHISNWASYAHVWICHAILSSLLTTAIN